MLQANRQVDRNSQLAKYKELYDLNYIIFSPNLLLRTHIPSLTSNTPFQHSLILGNKCNLELPKQCIFTSSKALQRHQNPYIQSSTFCLIPFPQCICCCFYFMYFVSNPTRHNCCFVQSVVILIFKKFYGSIVDLTVNS